LPRFWKKCGKGWYSKVDHTLINSVKFCKGRKRGYNTVLRFGGNGGKHCRGIDKNGIGRRVDGNGHCGDKEQKQGPNCGYTVNIKCGRKKNKVPKKNKKAPGPPGHKAPGPPGHKAPGPPGHKASGPPGHKASGPPGHKASESPDDEAPGPPGHDLLQRHEKNERKNKQKAGLLSLKEVKKQKRNCSKSAGDCSILMSVHSHPKRTSDKVADKESDKMPTTAVDHSGMPFPKGKLLNMDSIPVQKE